jgi:5-methylthioadenosine/S-adenosylhomocysteine deaminase
MQTELCELSNNFCIEARWVVPILYNNFDNPNHKALQDTAIIITNQQITDILPIHIAKNKYPNLPRKTLNTHAILPGFINTHSHSPMNLLKGYADDLPLMTWLEQHIWPIENKIFASDFAREFAFDGALLAIAEMLKNGITCFNDMYFYSCDIARAVETAGIRANVGTHVFDPAMPWAKNIDEFLERCLENINHYKNIHETLEEINQSLKKYNQRPIERLNNLGLFDSNLYAIHMTHLNQNEINLIAKKNIPIAHCPKSNLKLAGGFCPIQKLLAQNVNVALGTDSAASNNDLDILAELKFTSLVTKNLAGDPTIIPDHQALELATINGAKLMRLDHKIGSLTIGKEADMIAIDLSDHGSQPVYNPISSIVYTASKQQISDVWVRGVQKIANHKLIALDNNYIQNIINKWQERILYLKQN